MGNLTSKLGRKRKRVRRQEVLASVTEIHQATNRELSRAILREDRVDLLAELVGLEYHGFQSAIWEHQQEHRQTLILGPRGWGKSVIATVLKCAIKIIQNRNVRILIASSGESRAQDLLSSIKAILEHDRIVEIFGPFQSRKKWAETSIEVLGRSSVLKEPTVTIAGIGSAITSGHYDLIIADDLCTLTNSKTQVQRDNVKSWFGITLAPCVTGEETEFHVIGTRYHPDDLYHELIENPEFASIVIPALNPDGESNYPERFSTQYLNGQRRIMRIGGAWDSQMMMDPSSLQGDIFEDSFFKFANEHPADHFYTFTGVDLAIGQEDKHDKFAWVTVGVSASKLNQVFVLDYFTARMSVAKQDEAIYHNCIKFSPLITGIESNHFQGAKVQRLKEHDKHKIVPAVPIQTVKDKMTRAQLLAVRFERGEIIFMKHLDGSELISQLKGFPNHTFDDLFDALDMAIRCIQYRRARKTKKRKKRPGVIRARSPLARRAVR